MTIANAVNKSGPYFYNGAATSFAYGFKIDDAAHIRVVETVLTTGVETDLTLNSDYTVTGVGNDTGNVVISPARAAGRSVTLVRNVPFTQLTVLENQGAYFAEVVEAALDRAVARDQQLAEQISRAVVVPVSADATDLEDLIAGVVALLDSVDAVMTVASIAPQVVTVAANVTPISVVAVNITSVQDVAANMAAVLAVNGLAAQVAADRIQTAADRVATGQDRVATAADRVVTSADRVVTTADRAVTAADRAFTTADKAATAADRVQTGLDRAAAAASAASVNAAIISQSRRRNMSVNGSLIDSQETGGALSSATGYFYADQKVMYRSSDLAAKVSVQRVAYVSLAGNVWAAEFKCLATGIVAGSLLTDTDFIEGCDPEFLAAGWGAAGAKPIMYRKEVQKPAGTYSFHIANRAGNRHCYVQYVISAGNANQKVVVEVSIPGDTGGTWDKGAGNIGATIDDVLVAGTSFVGGTPGQWSANAFYAAAGQKNFLDNTANVARHTDFGARQDRDATGVYGEYRVGEVDEVYRSERYCEILFYPAGSGQILLGMNASGAFTVTHYFKVRKAAIPVATIISGTWSTVPSVFYNGDIMQFFHATLNFALNGSPGVAAVKVLSRLA